MSRAERLALVEWRHAELALSVQTELLGLSRSSLYYRPVPPSAWRPYRRRYPCGG